MKKAQFFHSTLIHSFIGGILVVAALNSPYKNSVWAAELAPVSQGAAPASDTVCTYCFTGTIGPFGFRHDIESTIKVKKGEKADIVLNDKTDKKTYKKEDIPITIDKDGNLKFPDFTIENDGKKTTIGVDLKLNKEKKTFTGTLKQDGESYSAKGTYSAVPEPVTILGSVVAVGFGAFLRKKYS